MEKNNYFNPELMKSSKLFELAVGSNLSIRTEIWKHYNSSLDKDLGEIKGFSAQVLNIEEIRNFITKRIKELTDQSVSNSHLMVFDKNNNYYIDTKNLIPPEYIKVDENGFFVTCEDAINTIKIWANTLKFVN